MERIIRICPACEQGEMVYTLAQKESFPPQFRHNCERCAFEAYYYEIYEKEETPSGDSTTSLEEEATALTTRFTMVMDYKLALKCAIRLVEYALELNLGQNEEDRHKKLLGYLNLKLREIESSSIHPSL